MSSAVRYAICSTANNCKAKIAFRGGTAIHKLLFGKTLRYSEDIDLVQTQAEPIGKIIDGVRAALPWLGKCNREQVALDWPPFSRHLVNRIRIG
ncbi:MAG: nucleotidyl transferase AbiEii/AbiGii toxin family protein [Planctomycetota bacterium]|nr:nucleotidyl transferase AbiEii/AbiGii toxin family protein [Planctomycetota bacterium]